MSAKNMVVIDKLVILLLINKKLACGRNKKNMTGEQCRYQ